MVAFYLEKLALMEMSLGQSNEQKSAYFRACAGERYPRIPGLKS